MLTVRLPNGVSLQFNEANHLTYNANGTWVLRREKDGVWVASIHPSGLLVEYDKPCLIGTPGANEYAAQLDQIRHRLTVIQRRLPKKRKRK